MPVSTEDIAAYARDGVVCLRAVVPPAWIDRLRLAVEADMAEPGPDVEIYTKAGDPGLFFNDFDLARRWPDLDAFVREGPLGAVAGALMGARAVTFFVDQMFAKEPGTEGLTHWHQDQPYMAVEGWQFCSSWLPLDPVTRETTLEFVRGSHRWGFYAPLDSYVDGSRHPGYGYARVPDIEARRAAHDIAAWELSPGDVLVFQGKILHQGRNNPTRDLRRRALVHRWLGDDARYIQRDPPAEFPKFPTALGDGDRFDTDPQFPVVWRGDAA